MNSRHSVGGRVAAAAWQSPEVDLSTLLHAVLNPGDALFHVAGRYRFVRVERPPNPSSFGHA